LWIWLLSVETSECLLFPIFSHKKGILRNSDGPLNKLGLFPLRLNSKLEVSIKTSPVVISSADVVLMCQSVKSSEPPLPFPRDLTITWQTMRWKQNC
jgi:hypothetical protein